MTSHLCIVRFFSIIAATSALSGLHAHAAQPAELRIGIVGLDTSHVVQFTGVLNDVANKNHLAGARIVGAFRGGSPDIEASASRIDGFTKEVVEKYGVKLYDSIEELARNVDAIMIESNDGRVHLDQAKRALPFHKPLFIDKPFASSLRDAIEIFRLAKQAGVPVFTSSSLRYSAGMATFRRPEIGTLVGALAYGPAAIESHHPDLFWYGIHATESLFVAMGRGCERVTRTHTAETDVVTGVWSDGRVGTVRGMRGVKAEYGIVAFGTKGVVEGKLDGAYAALLKEVLGFFRTGIAPVFPAEAIEIYAFMEAADESKRRGGSPVTIAEVLRASGGTAEMTR
ncbi:MAG: gfo/Idh/MocA family oxidoreductase [Opitutus sp.]|nr:gfo/Idh/MocA family oxidoreductase [Opitutus sp.]